MIWSIISCSRFSFHPKFSNIYKLKKRLFLNKRNNWCIDETIQKPSLVMSYRVFLKSFWSRILNVAFYYNSVDSWLNHLLGSAQLISCWQLCWSTFNSYDLCIYNILCQVYVKLLYYGLPITCPRMSRVRPVPVVVPWCQAHPSQCSQTSHDSASYIATSIQTLFSSNNSDN